MQATQVPQSLLGLVSTGKGISTNNSPRKNHEPAFLFNNNECLPIQPKPAFSASGRSKIGAESTNGRKLNCWQCWAILSPNCFKRLRINLW